MSFSTSVARLSDFYKRYGFFATARRARLALNRALFSNSQVVFYCDLNLDRLPQVPLPSFLRIERKREYSDLSPQDLHDMTSFWNPVLAERNILERLSKRASLWLIKSGDQLAGFGWTLRGATIEPHYLPLAGDDVHLFDFHVFPEYRGRGLNPLLVTHILQSVAGESAVRAFIEAAEWNGPQLSSLTKTPFQRLGLARKLTFLGCVLVWWKRPQAQKLQLGERREGYVPHASESKRLIATDSQRGCQKS